ncbi:MAG: ATP-binding protein [Pseudomonas marincola]
MYKINSPGKILILLVTLVTFAILSIITYLEIDKLNSADNEVQGLIISISDVEINTQSLLTRAHVDRQYPKWLEAEVNYVRRAETYFRSSKSSYLKENSLNFGKLENNLRQLVGRGLQYTEAIKTDMQALLNRNDMGYTESLQVYNARAEHRLILLIENIQAFRLIATTQKQLLHKMVRSIEKEINTKKQFVQYLGAATLILLLITIIVFLRNRFKELKRERKLAQQYSKELEQRSAALQKSEARLSLHIQNTPLGCISWDRNFCCTEWNKSAEKMFGYSVNEAIGLHACELIVPARLKDLVNNIFQQLLLQKGGSLSTNENNTKDGETIICDWHNTVIVDENNDVVAVTSLILDITERTRLEDQLRQSQKMEAVGQLTGGIAHDFNNMLGIIMGNLDFLRDKIDGDAKAMGFLEQAYRGVERGADITRKLLAFSGGKGGVLQLTNVNCFITDLERLIAKSLTPKITVKTVLADDIWNTNIDPGELENALLNLSLNASHVMPDDGLLVIETSNEILDEQYVQMTPGSSTGEYVMISITDTGCGMTADVVEQIFQPFFTTKEAGKGTGLGLSMVYGFVQRSEGHITVNSEPGKGSTFNIYLPRAMGEPDTVRKFDAEIVAALPRGGETILVVDDEEGLLDVAVGYLEDLGYKTQTATSGKRALEILHNSNNIELLFSDVVMPGGIDGYDLGMKVLELYPNIKVLLTSGFTPKLESALNEGVPLVKALSKDLLNKPYNQLELALAIRKALDGEVIND